MAKVGAGGERLSGDVTLGAFLGAGLEIAVRAVWLEPMGSLLSTKGGVVSAGITLKSITKPVTRMAAAEPQMMPIISFRVTFSPFIRVSVQGGLGADAPTEGVTCGGRWPVTSAVAPCQEKSHLRTWWNGRHMGLKIPRRKP